MIGSGRGYGITCPTGLPVFRNFTPSQSCIDGIDTFQIAKSVLDQDIAEFNLQGSWLDLPGGEIGYAVGTSYRKNEYQFSPGNPFTMLTDNPIGLFASAPTGGETDVKEYYGEVLLPIVDRAGFRARVPLLRLQHGRWARDLQGALHVPSHRADQLARRTSGRHARPEHCRALYGADADRRGPPGRRSLLRDHAFAVGQRGDSREAAAPPRTTRIVRRSSICAGSSSATPLRGSTRRAIALRAQPAPLGFHRQNPAFFPLEIELRQGNPNVGPETGITYTFGAVFDGLFGADNLTVTADLYQIHMKDAISPIAAYIVYNNCFNWNGQTNPTYDINNCSAE